MEFWSFFFGPNSHRFVLKEGVKTSSCEPHLILHWNVDMCRSLILISMIHIYIYTWNLNGLYFWRSTPQNKAFSNQNKDYIHIIQILIVLPRSPLSQSYQESMILITPSARPTKTSQRPQRAFLPLDDFFSVAAGRGMDCFYNDKVIRFWWLFVSFIPIFCSK